MATPHLAQRLRVKFVHLGASLVDNQRMEQAPLPGDTGIPAIAADPPLRMASWISLSPGAVALAIAFLGVVAVGRMISAKPARAGVPTSGSLSVYALPALPSEIGLKPILTLVGRDAIVRISLSNGHRYYSVFDRSGYPLATRMSKLELARAFPRLKLESMQDVASGFSVDGRLLADTPDE